MSNLYTPPQSRDLKLSGAPEAAGVLLCAPFADRQEEPVFLAIQRSQYVSCSHQWALAAGSLESGETAIDAAYRELKEATGIDLKAAKVDLHKLCVTFGQRTGHRFTTFIGVLTPRLSGLKDSVERDTMKYSAHLWTTLGRWPEPVHQGLRHVFNEHPRHDILLRVQHILLNPAFRKDLN